MLFPGSLTHFLTDNIVVVLAGLAPLVLGNSLCGTAREIFLEYDPVAHLDVLHISAGLFHNADGLMAHIGVGLIRRQHGKAHLSGLVHHIERHVGTADSSLNVPDPDEVLPRELRILHLVKIDRGKAGTVGVLREPGCGHHGADPRQIIVVGESFHADSSFNERSTIILIVNIITLHRRERQYGYGISTQTNCISPCPVPCLPSVALSDKRSGPAALFSEGPLVPRSLGR